MKADNRLSSVLHILLHMAEIDEPVTSAALATMMQTNPVVVRRILGGLREQGLVSSEKGHGGGWRLAFDLNKVTMHDLYIALGSPTIFAIGNRTESPNCLVEGAVNAVMNQAIDDAKNTLLTRFREVTLAELSGQMHQLLEGRKKCPQENHSRQ